MDTKSARAERIAVALDGRSIAWLADEIGVALSTAHSYIKGTVPPADMALRIAEVLNVNIAWYIRGDSVTPETEPLNVDVPLIDHSFSVVGSLNYSAQLVQGLSHDLKRVLSLIQKGNAMRPSIPESAEVLVVLDVETIEDGEIYLLRVGNRVILRRVMLSVCGNLYAVCDNPSFRLEEKELVDPHTVIGQAVWVSHRP